MTPLPVGRGRRAGRRVVAPVACSSVRHPQRWSAPTPLPPHRNLIPTWTNARVLIWFLCTWPSRIRPLQPLSSRSLPQCSASKFVILLPAGRKRDRLRQPPFTFLPPQDSGSNVSLPGIQPAEPPYPHLVSCAPSPTALPIRPVVFHSLDCIRFVIQGDKQTRGSIHSLLP